MLLGELGGLSFSFLSMEIYGIVQILFGMKQDIKQLLNQIFGITFLSYRKLYEWLEPVRWKWSHFRHHGYTYFDDPLILK